MEMLFGVSVGDYVGAGFGLSVLMFIIVLVPFTSRPAALPPDRESGGTTNEYHFYTGPHIAWREAGLLHRYTRPSSHTVLLLNLPTAVRSAECVSSVAEM